MVTLGVMVGEQFQIDAYLGVLQKANVQANPPVVESSIASERGQIHTWVIHRTVGVGCLLKTEHRAVELGGDFDVVHDDVDVGDGLNVPSRGKVGHYFSPQPPCECGLRLNR